VYFKFVQKGDEALAGRDEINITHRFPPDETKTRTVWFKGFYFSTFDEETHLYHTHVENKIPTTEYVRYTVPVGYSVYVRDATVRFEV
jgi:hypothetical protein